MHITELFNGVWCNYSVIWGHLWANIMGHPGASMVVFGQDGQEGLKYHHLCGSIKPSVLSILKKCEHYRALCTLSKLGHTRHPCRVHLCVYSSPRKTLSLQTLLLRFTCFKRKKEKKIIVKHNLSTYFRMHVKSLRCLKPLRNN